MLWASLKYGKKQWWLTEQSQESIKISRVYQSLIITYKQLSSEIQLKTWKLHSMWIDHVVWQRIKRVQITQKIFARPLWLDPINLKWTVLYKLLITNLSIISLISFLQPIHFWWCDTYKQNIYFCYIAPLQNGGTQSWNIWPSTIFIFQKSLDLNSAKQAEKYKKLV